MLGRPSGAILQMTHRTSIDKEERMDDTPREGLPLLQPEEAWRALAYRVMSVAPMRVTPEQPPIEILPAQLPAGLPVEIPLPGGSRIVGSVLGGGGLETVTVYGDALGAPEDVLAFYRERLEGDGWYEVDRDRQRPGGFNHIDHSYQASAHFCRDERGPALFVEATRRDSATTTLRVLLYTDERNPVCLPHERRGPPPNPIPPLPPPSGARFVMGAGPATRAWTDTAGSEPGRTRDLGGNLGPDSAHSSVELGTDLDLHDLATHYNRHLEAGGWSKGETGQSELTAWSRWTFRRERDEPWRGLLIVFQRPDVPQRYIVQVLAEWLREP